MTCRAWLQEHRLRGQAKIPSTLAPRVTSPRGRIRSTESVTGHAGIRVLLLESALLRVAGDGRNIAMGCIAYVSLARSSHGQTALT